MPVPARLGRAALLAVALLASLAPAARRPPTSSRPRGSTSASSPPPCGSSIDLPAGADLGAAAADVEAIDAAPLDGRAVVRVRPPGSACGRRTPPAPA